MYECLPVGIYGSMVQVACADPMNPEMVNQLGFAIGKEVMAVVADPAQIEKVLPKVYPEEADGLGDILKELGADLKLDEIAQGPQLKDITDLNEMAKATPIVKFVNLVLFQAVQDRASDIHFEPFEDEFKIRYRVDGALYEMSPPPKHLALPV